MLFRFETDQGALISFHLIPDNGRSIPSVVIKGDGVELTQLRSNRTDAHLAKSGRHSTGQCGFVITPQQVPNLAGLSSVEITDAESGIIVYRRPRPEFREMRLFRLETHLLPLWRFDDAMRDLFQYWFKGIDRYGRETTQQTFTLIRTESIYSSGRLYMQTFEKFLQRGLRAITLVRDPYDELAERLLILKSAGPRAVDLLGQRDMMIFDEVIADLDELRAFDEPSLRQFIRQAPLTVLEKLSNPLVRQLTASSPSDSPPKSSLSHALQVLAQFTVPGLRAEPAEFSAAVAELLDVPPDSVPVLKEFAKVTEIGQILREIRDVEAILEKDLEVYHNMTQAFGSIASGQISPDVLSALKPVPGAKPTAPAKAIFEDDDDLLGDGSGARTKMR